MNTPLRNIRPNQVSGSWFCGFTVWLATIVAVASLSSMLFAEAQTKSSNQDKDAIERGAMLVESRCSFCHDQTSLIELARQSIKRNGYEYFATFFKRHHAPDERERADMISYLVSITVKE